MRTRMLVAGGLAALAILLVAGSALGASPSVGYAKNPTDRTVKLIFYGIADPTGTREVWISCDNGVNRSERYPFATSLVVSLELPGCEGYGYFPVWVQVEEADASYVFGALLHIEIWPTMTLVFPKPAVTGQPFTIDPQWPADYSAEPGSRCRYEFRWGTDRALSDGGPHDETYGLLLFDVDAVGGKCPAWTFTLPWVPYPQFDIRVEPWTLGSDGSFNFSIEGAQHRFKATVGGTERRIVSSNLPLVQVLPSTYTPIVGHPVTYTRYLLAGARAGTAEWHAWQGTGDDAIHWIQKGGATFTITPRSTGNVTVAWDKLSGTHLLGTIYDPRVRRPDRYRPNTTAPVQHLASGIAGDRVPVTLTWDGSDTGWGIAKYQLERSMDGGAWKRLVSAKVKSFSQTLATGHRYKYRVRAVDKAGNRGYWDYGPTFRPKAPGDSSSAITYRGAWSLVPDVTATAGRLHEADTAGAKATFTFKGRDVAWVAERGPTHGRAKVYIDGKHVKTVDLSASADAPRRIMFRRHWKTRGTHQVRIVVEGTSGRPTVDVDGFLVLR